MDRLMGSGHKEPHGVAAGEIARSLAVPHNTLSSHLSILTHARLFLYSFLTGCAEA